MKHDLREQSMSRRNIYYWKCDRSAAFHGTQVRADADPEIEAQLSIALREYFGADRITIRAAPSQGNHLTWHARVNERDLFVRVENGPERDSQFEVESALMRLVAATGVPTPEVFGCDATRSRVPFAWQALQRIDSPDLNHWHKKGRLDAVSIARDIGVAVATWQGIRLQGSGPFNADAWRAKRVLRGYHATYEEYFRLRLDEHLHFLVERGFMPVAQRDSITRAIDDHRALLALSEGCLVHKDLALWNILGSESQIAAFIDFDDAISGDPLDDLSLLGCFHDGAFLQHALDGFQSIRPLPREHRQRFWLHLLRNMIVKAVIRVGAGYFDRDDGFFLIGAGNTGAGLKRLTHERLSLALRGLATGADMSIL